MDDEKIELLARVNSIVRPYGCMATQILTDSVGVQGDARVYGPSVCIVFPSNTSHKEISRISTEIINKVSGITRVLMEIPASPRF